MEPIFTNAKSNLFLFPWLDH